VYWHEECAKRREALCQMVSPGTVVLVPAAQLYHVPGTRIPLPFRQEANFFFLTGVYDDSDMVCSLEVSPDGKSFTYKLFCAEEDAERQRWEGQRYSPKDAKALRADCVEPVGSFPSYVRGIHQENRPVVLDAKMWRGHPLASHVLGPSANTTLRKQSNHLDPVLGKSVTYDTLEQLLHELRWRKSEAEVDMMRASAEITTGAFNQCMALSHPSMNERQLSSLFEFLCKQEGAQRMPYPQVVAGGNNACTIHYSSNNRRVFGGELVLMDAGCDFYGYVSDVTRTWPVSGKFTEPQREVYEHVLEAHRECVEVCVEGNTLRDIHKMSVHLLSRALSKLGIVQKSTQQIILRGLYKPYYPHSIGHWLGMDTHDVHTVSALRPFEEGVVLTIEPGLYLPRNVHDIPAQYRGIGIRLEDDVLVRGGGLGPEVLSGNVPISPEDVEDLVGTWMDQEHQPAPEGEDQVDLTSASSLVGQQGSLGVYYNHPSKEHMARFWSSKLNKL